MELGVFVSTTGEKDGLSIVEVVELSCGFIEERAGIRMVLGMKVGAALGYSFSTSPGIKLGRLLIDSSKSVSSPIVFSSCSESWLIFEGDGVGEVSLGDGPLNSTSVSNTPNTTITATKLLK